MSRAGYRSALGASVVLLGLGLGLVLTRGPQRQPRADLEAVPPVTSTTGLRMTTSPMGHPSAHQDTDPVRLRIPSIGVDAPIAAVGRRLDGQMDLPPATQVGWYRPGPVPGAPGSAVLAGHVDLAGERGAFFDLAALPVGARIEVQGGDATRTFVVTAREQVPKATLDPSRYFTRSGPARITLITCGGAFDRQAHRYEDNLIITADRLR